VEVVQDNFREELLQAVVVRSAMDYLDSRRNIHFWVIGRESLK
jgi:hypothetical protein